MTYEKPEVVDYGKLEDLTAGGQDGDFLDQAFNILTPRADLTFS
jgi:hypothetical protein